MSLVTQLTAAFQRVGTEFKSVRAALLTKQMLLTAITSTTAPASPAAGNYYQINPSAPQSLTLPTSNKGDVIGFMQTNLTTPGTNTITISGTINGTTNTGIVLSMGNEAKILIADQSGGWAVYSSNYGKAALDARYAATFSTTSTTSNTLGTGSKSFTVAPALGWTAGQYILITNTGTPANNMVGTVTSYNSTSGAMVVNVASFAGSGTFTAWSLNLTGAPGPAGVTPVVNSSTAMVVSGGAATPNAALGNIQTATITANLTLNTPINPTHLQSIEYIIYNSSAGALSVAFSSAFVFGNTSPAANFTTVAPGSYTRVYTQFNSSAGVWVVTGYNQGSSA